MIRVWKISENASEELHLEDQSSLDAITRQLPNGYYSTFRTYDSGTRVLALKSHLRRLYEPVDKPDVNVSQLRRSLLPLLEHLRPDEARVRAVMTKQGQIYVAIEPLKPLPKDVYEKGVSVETTEIQRNAPRLKSTAFIGASDAERRHIAQEGIFEALLVKHGKILEGMTSNFFYVLNARAERGDKRLSGSADEARSFLQSRASSAGLTNINPSAQREVLFTAQRDILLGVTRGTVIHLARGRGVEVKYQPLKLNQLTDVSESFITSSSRGVVPVVQIDNVTVGQGRVGQITRMLLSAYEEYVLKNAEHI